MNWGWDEELAIKDQFIEKLVDKIKSLEVYHQDELQSLLNSLTILMAERIVVKNKIKKLP